MGIKKRDKGESVFGRWELEALVGGIGFGISAKWPKRFLSRGTLARKKSTLSLLSGGLLSEGRPFFWRSTFSHYKTLSKNLSGTGSSYFLSEGKAIASRIFSVRSFFDPINKKRRRKFSTISLSPRMLRVNFCKSVQKFSIHGLFVDLVHSILR
ncbi:hypothetical protein EUGRSUZ_C01095 [Eucalyptus grandis]|uniref:Uncharacterized protein n=2 Tax=Eucalyptus grandis TaxID=71139 RepID=A0ACC3LC12_EUCGR|nr:hypothetical protein EUGRSUZ_C01095 [Eucalyptus grandis]